MIGFLLALIAIGLLCFVLYKAFERNQELITKHNKLVEQVDGYHSYMFEGRFHIGDVMSAYSGLLLSPKKEEGIRELASYMTGRTVDLQNLAQEVDKIIPSLVEQFPWLKEIPFNQVSEDNWEEFRDNYAIKYGDYLNVKMAL